MSVGSLVVAVFAYVFVCILPFIFFRGDGTWNFKWILTAAPYVVAPILLTMNYMGYLSAPMGVSLFQEIAGVVLCCLSIALIGSTMGSNRVPLALWHQDNDAPKNIVTYGAYKRVRHPFYTSFILGVLGGLLLFPSWQMAALLTYVYTALNVTAAREERRLSSSQYGDEYKAYMKVTGRFFPRFT